MEKSFHDAEYRKMCSEKTLQTNSKGFFMNFVEIVVKNAGKTWITNVFGKLKTDKERIRAIYSSETTREALVSILSNVQEIYRKKNAQVSHSKSLEGDDAYNKGEFKKSLLLYSQSVIRAPESGNGSEALLSVILWKRSLALISLEEYSLALTNIQHAIKTGLPNIYKQDAYWKMAICYKALNEENKANVSFSIAEKLLGNSGRLENLNEDRRALFVYKKSKETKVDPDIFTSKKISIKYESDKGRHAIANQIIQTGETLVVEKPYAANLLPEMFGTHCHHCFERLIAPIGCTECSNVAFCKLECRDVALATYHKYECKYIDLLIGSGMSILAHTALRMITQNEFRETMNIYHNKKNEPVYSLCTNAEKRSAEDFLQRTLMAAFLMKCLQKSEYFGDLSENALPSEEEYCIGELLLFHLQMLQFNAHEIYESGTMQKNSKRSQTVYIGVAVYPTVALFNHDCYPAVIRYFVGKNIVIKASRRLESNDPIAENYGPIFTRRRLADRQRSLYSRYWFNCRCNACIFNWPSYEDGLADFSSLIKCTTESCSFTFTLPISNQEVQCPICRKDINLTEQIQWLKWCKGQYNRAVTEFSQNQQQKAVVILCEAIDMFHRFCCPPHKETHLAQEKLQTWMASLGNVFEVSS